MFKQWRQLSIEFQESYQIDSSLLVVNANKLKTCCIFCVFSYLDKSK